MVEKKEQSKEETELNRRIAEKYGLPEMEPYEQKATAKQRSYIWSLGWHDEEAIGCLGKKQASAAIEELKTAGEPSKGLGLAITIIVAAVFMFAVGAASNIITRWIAIVFIVFGILCLGWYIFDHRLKAALRRNYSG